MDLIKREHTSKICKYINATCQIQRGGNITAGDSNVNKHWTRTDKQSELEVGIIETNIRFILTYMTPLMIGGTSSQALGDTVRENISREIIIRRILFTSGF